MKIKVTIPFKFAEDGHTITSYEKGTHKVSKRCAEVAIAAGWAKRTRTVRTSKRKSS